MAPALASFVPLLLLVLLLSTMSPSPSGVLAQSSPGTAPTSTSENGGGSGTRRRLGILTAAMPWTFGPYQNQAYQLSLLLSEKYGGGGGGGEAAGEPVEWDGGYDIVWMSFSHKLRNEIPSGEYSYDEVRRHIPGVVPPPDDFVLDHITFVGTRDGQQQQQEDMKVSNLNRLARRHDLSAIITLMDITQLEPDVPFSFPAVGWVPLHSDDGPISRSEADYWVMRVYHGLAALSPTSAHALASSVGHPVELGDVGEVDDGDGGRRIEMARDVFGSTEVRFVPHIIDWRAIDARAKRGNDLLERYSLMDADAKLQGQPPLRDRGMEDLATLQGGDGNNLFGPRRAGDFVILLQGGNYDEHDRKGWDTSFQAFARFYHALPADDDSRSKVHLLIHSMESYLVEADNNSNKEAPAALMPKGHLHQRILHELGVPREVYTIDMNVHATEVVAAYKRRASVCLHPSKVEGFGMNVLECQSVGTPVITTNYTAMADFTMLGTAVPHRQSIKYPNNPYRMAMPDVGGIADALRVAHDEHLSMVAEGEGGDAARALRQKRVEETREWIDSTFSPAAVTDSFLGLLTSAIEEHDRRAIGTMRLLGGRGPPETGAYRIISGYHTDLADWDEPWTLIAPDGMEVLDPTNVHSLCWSMYMSGIQQSRVEGGEEATNFIAVLASYDDGKQIWEKEVHEWPVIVRTHLIASLQMMVTRRKSLVALAYEMARNPQTLPLGLVAVRSRRAKGASDYRDEL